MLTNGLDPITIQEQILMLLAAGGVHRNVALSKDTEVQLYSKDVAKVQEPAVHLFGCKAVL